MGALLGLTFGTGILLIWRSFHAPAERYAPSWRRLELHRRLEELIAQAGLEAVTPRQLILSSAGLGAIIGMVFLAVSRTWPIALAFTLFGAYAPMALVRMRARARQRELRDLWPDAVDNLASAIRAGLALPEALTQLGSRGPEPLRRPFERFGEDYRATGRFGHSLDMLKRRLADPTGDRVVESLRIARDVGGSDLGRLLRTLSSFLREDARTRSELETRQSWVVNAARLAVAAPWILLALLSLRSASVQAFNAPSGWLVLAGGAGLCLVAYRLMMHIGRLPQEERVLR
ncbi:type II secretion system protein F [Actinobacteria bacterium YIM 96077]|uniref:Type II secretion system protein F n=1 Tax=Phytoactinopolyspora halophila TaxID=1981511 RepID=A0A329R6M1_9ACTN|nr:type II secretion system F family protein [Phytoactinopolyspora halophila]AYY12087.1 type II secretion system protein F [Actinobacteria bacterium YIM 96077]RAW18678.1 type II secretion system protein F [Phytoactinopolyspora halophila]